GEYIVHAGQDEVQHGKHSLLDFTGVSRSPDQNDLPGKVDDGEIPLSRSVTRRVSVKAGRVNDQPVRCKIGELLRFRSQKHIVSKEVRPGVFGDHPKLNLVPGICACIHIARKDFAAIQVGANFLQQTVKSLWIEWDVDVIPPYLLVGDCISYNEAIARCAPFELTSVYRYGPCGSSRGLSQPDGDVGQLVW